MAKRKAYAPFSLTSEAGVSQTPVEGYIDVEQNIQPIVNTGTINENGTWAGVKSDDEQFIGLSKAEAVANTATTLFPDTNDFPSIDMSGFTSLQFALKVTNGGNYGVKAVFGPDTVPFANLTPIQPAETIKIIDSIGGADESLFDDTIAVNYANSWFIVTVLANRAKGQKNLQVSVQNNSGDVSTIEFGFRRLV